MRERNRFDCGFRVARAGPETRRDVLGDDQRRDVVVRRAVVLVPGDQQQATLLPDGGCQQARHQAAQEVVRGGGAAVVAVVTEVGRDPHEPRRGCGQVSLIESQIDEQLDDLRRWRTELERILDCLGAAAGS